MRYVYAGDNRTPFSRLAQAGHSENLADQSTLHAEKYSKSPTLTADAKAGSVKASAQSMDADTGSPSDYTPQPGDVVEFEYNGLTCKGIVFLSSNNNLTITRSNNSSEDLGYNSVKGNISNPVYLNVKKTGTSSLCLNGLNVIEARNKAKAYFSRPQFKVGDRVRIARKPRSEELKEFPYSWTSRMTEKVGDLFTISLVNNGTCCVMMKGSGFHWPLCCLEPA